METPAPARRAAVDDAEATTAAEKDIQDIKTAKQPATQAVEEELRGIITSSPPPRKASDDQISSDDVSEAASDITDGAILDENEVAGDDFDEDINAAPGHLHALSRIPDPRLRGIPRPNSEGKLSSSGVVGEDSAAGRRSRSNSRSRAGGLGGSMRSANSSRSSSPLPSRQRRDAETGRGGAAGDASTAYSTAGTHQSGHSSLDGIYDPDLLLDRLGFIDLDPPLPHEIRCGPLAAPETGLTPVNERLSEETLEDCHAFNDLVIDNLKQHITHHGGGQGGGMSSTMSMPSVAHSSLSGVRSDMSVGSLSVGSYKGGHSRGGSVTGGSLMGDGENSVLLGTLDEEGEDEDEGSR